MRHKNLVVSIFSFYVTYGSFEQIFPNDLLMILLHTKEWLRPTHLLLRGLPILASKQTTMPLLATTVVEKLIEP